MPAAQARQRIASAWQRFHTPPEPLPAARHEAAIRAMRTRCLAEGLLAFMLGFSVDDLHVLRYPGWVLGLAAAVLLVSLGPIWHGVMRARNLRPLNDADFASAMLSTTRRGKLSLVVVAIVATFWMIVFSEGVPPWAI